MLKKQFLLSMLKTAMLLNIFVNIMILMQFNASNATECIFAEYKY